MLALGSIPPETPGLRQVAQGDPDAFACLHERYARELHPVALGVLKEHIAEAKEAVSLAACRA